MGGAAHKRILVIARHSPYGSSLARSAIDVILAAAAFEQKFDLLFLGDGVLHLMPDQEAQQLGVRSMGRLLASLPLYDVECVYVDRTAVTRFNLDLSRAPVNTHALDSPETHQLFLRYDHLLGF